MYETSRKFAIAKHGSQKYGKHSYNYHLDAVANIAKQFGTAYMVTAQLHDIIEDTCASVDELSELFGFTIARAVVHVTDPELDGREAKKKAINHRLSKLKADNEADKIALIVKACDRLANVREGSKQRGPKYQRYILEHAEFRNAAYRPNLCDNIWKELDELLIPNY